LIILLYILVVFTIIFILLLSSLAIYKWWCLKLFKKEVSKVLKWGWSLESISSFEIIDNGFRIFIYLKSDWGKCCHSVSFIRYQLHFKEVLNDLDRIDYLNGHRSGVDLVSKNIEYNRERKLKELGL